MQWRDDGRGFDADAKRATTLGGNGLVNMRRRVERLGGEITFESEDGKGTRVRISVPVSHAGLAGVVRKIVSGQSEK